METTKINHSKIIIRTLLKVLVMIVIIFILNSWPSIMQSFKGNVPPLDYWLDHSFKPSNIILIVGFGAYFYYSDWSKTKEALKKEKEINEKWDNI